MAALLYAGPGSVITGPVALMHHSIRGGPNMDVIDVLVPIERQRLSTGFAGCTVRSGCRPGSRQAGRCAWLRRLGPWPIPRGSSPDSETSAPWWQTPFSWVGARPASWPTSSGTDLSRAPRCSARSWPRWPTASGPRPKAICAT
jgi:hypothetical protein